MGANHTQYLGTINFIECENLFAGWNSNERDEGNDQIMNCFCIEEDSVKLVLAEAKFLCYNSLNTHL